MNNNQEEKREVDVERKEIEKDTKENDSQSKSEEVYDIPVGKSQHGVRASMAQIFVLNRCS